MALQTAVDVPLNITSENSRSERRITPAWTVAQLKGRLEPITGIPALSQRLTLKLGGSQAPIDISAADEETTQLASFPLQAYAELNVTDTRPTHLRASQNYTDVSLVDKYVMPADVYSNMQSNTVLSYKRTHHLGRFDPSAPTTLAATAALYDREIEERNITVGARCRLLPAHAQIGVGGGGAGEDGSDRRGEVAFVGPVEGLPGVGAWVGIRLDEPTGKNEGEVGGKRYFETEGRNRGVFVRPERVEIGDFEVVDEFAEEMEEI